MMGNQYPLEVNLKLTMFVRRRGDEWIARCPEMDIFVQCCTEDEAKELLTKEAHSWIESIRNRGILRDVVAGMDYYNH